MKRHLVTLKGTLATAALLLGTFPVTSTGCAKGASTTDTGTTGGDDGDGGSASMNNCPEPFVTCSDDCVDPRTDETHCGGCGNACAEGVVCDDGQCTAGCDADQILCGASCIAPATDHNFCGASGDCAGANEGVTCEANEICVDGGCVLDCGTDEVLCDDTCVNPNTDINYCGAIDDCADANAGTVCGGPISTCPGAMDDVCDEGNCAPACEPGSQTFSFTGAAEMFTVPACAVEVTVKSWGAQGGTAASGGLGGLGAYVEGLLCVTGGVTLTIVVGEQAPTAPYPCGGGGGSFVSDGTTPLFVAGAGGGGYFDWDPGPNSSSTLLVTDGNGIGGLAHNDAGGGGGFSLAGLGTSGSGGLSFLNGAAFGLQFPTANTNSSRGGFGGGAGASQSGTFNAGGGGGYDGGNAGNGSSSTGGTSFITPLATTTVHTPSTRTGHGEIQISWQ